MSLKEVNEVEAMEDTPLIQFWRDERSRPRISHNNALVITAVLANYEVRAIFIDSGSSVDILFGEAYDQIQLRDVSLEKVNTSLYRFAGEVVHPRGTTRFRGNRPQGDNPPPQHRPWHQASETEKRHFGPKKDKVIQAEVDKLMVAGHIEEIQFPEWLSNVVLVPKPGEKWRMCIDFRDLNKACPKDFYPLPRIDQHVESTSDCELLSMMDASQGYHQIMLAPEDRKKVSFITSSGTFCYVAMPFGLKRTGATYQRLVDKIF
ncbi:UNVERIFIED_CONTAM: Transposon Ty3-G Gag-Pol polyprotein [Sesamum radiatum]|uniref:Transposon Ty3-G Gag-Pol polyprotein n=1 Tax=Sesamum radiatum TaxID=300843 RepID=A0AAW2Q0E0_SESRA